MALQGTFAAEGSVWSVARVLSQRLWCRHSAIRASTSATQIATTNGAKTIAHPTTALTGSCVCTAYMRINHIAGIHSSHRAPVIRQYDLLSALTQHSTDWFLTILRRRDEIFNAGGEGHLSFAAREHALVGSKFMQDNRSLEPDSRRVWLVVGDTGLVTDVLPTAHYPPDPRALRLQIGPDGVVPDLVQSIPSPKQFDPDDT